MIEKLDLTLTREQVPDYDSEPEAAEPQPDPPTANPPRPMRTPAEEALHQKYLERVIDKVGRLTLAEIAPQLGANHVALEKVYVDLPTAYVLCAEVVDHTIRDWWVESIDRTGGRAEMGAHGAAGDPAERRTRPRDLGWQDDAGLTALIARAQAVFHNQSSDAGSARSREVKDGVHTVSSLSAGQVTNACPRLVVLGAPGSGKSTLTRHLALCLAGEEYLPWRGGDSPLKRSASLARLPGWTHGALTPVYVELRHFIASCLPGDLQTRPTVEHLWNYIRSEIVGTEFSETADQLENDLRDGRALLILDGLDEVPYPAGEGCLEKRQNQLRELAVSLEDRWSRSRIVVASRPFAYKNWEIEGYHSLHIAPFGDAERVALAANLFRVARKSNPEAKATRLNAEITRKNIPSDLSNNPMFITLMAALSLRDDREEELPATKGELYRESVLLLLERWTKAKSGMTKLEELLGTASTEALLARLALLAHEVHKGRGADSAAPEIPLYLLCGALLPMQMKNDTVQTARLVTYLSENSGLLISPGHRNGDPVFHFAHRTFQEYLAAKHLVDVECTKGNYRKDFTAVRKLIVSNPNLWRVPCLFVGDVLCDTGGDLWQLVEDLLGGDVPAGMAWDADHPHWWAVWLAAAIVQEQEVVAPNDRGRDAAVRYALIKSLVKLVETPGALEPRERAHAGRVLGLLGDPRPGVALDANGLPDIYLAWGDPVLPGVYSVGGDLEVMNPLPPSMETVSHSFRLSKYPVTNAQFQSFVDADTEGYNAPGYWTKAGLEWKGERRAPGVSEGTFGLPNHPRVDVSWYEAMAFCSWLTVRYCTCSLLSAGTEIRLPTEFEWEICARGSDGRIYPYGNEFDASKGNVYETGIGQTSAVGLFPDGASRPYGVLDMSGNTWEWCLTAYEKEGALSNHPAGTAPRVLRGGSWGNVESFARACSRNVIRPSRGVGYFGFRVAVCPIESLSSEG